MREAKYLSDLTFVYAWRDDVHISLVVSEFAFVRIRGHGNGDLFPLEISETFTMLEFASAGIKAAP